MSIDNILGNLTDDETSLVIDALMFYASCDVSSDISSDKINLIVKLAVSLAKEIDFKSEDLSYVKDMVYEDEIILEQFKPFIIEKSTLK